MNYQKAGKLRELFSRPEIIRLVGAHNGLSAKLIEEAGFDGVWASSLEMSASQAVPDANILTMTDYLQMAISMNEAVSIPVVVDVDQGYGNALNVIRMVDKFETAGIAGIIMEDKQFSKQNSLLSDGKHKLVSLEEYAGKIRAAKDTQKNDEFMVIARTEALIANAGMDEAFVRAKAYAEAGADAIMIHSKKKDPYEILNFVSLWGDDQTPLVIVPTSYTSFTENKIKQYPNIKMVIYSNHLIRSAVLAMQETLKEINETGGVQTIEGKITPLEEIFRLQGTPQMKEWERKYLPAKPDYCQK